MYKLIICLTVLLTPSATLLADEPPIDPLVEILQPHLKPTIAILLEHYRTGRKYSNTDFPMSREKFANFKAEIKMEFARNLGIMDWVVRTPTGKLSPICDRFDDRLIRTIEMHGVAVEVHVITLQPTGLVVPMTICLPKGIETQRAPGVCVFSGHTTHGLHDLVVNLESYQQGVAIRLAQAGFVSIAVEKIDTGYLSRDGIKGNDENAAATLMLSWGSVLRSHQLRACLAATEILAHDNRVDETRIGATGVSLGGWLAVQTAMLNDRIVAVADFGRKTRSVSMNIAPNQFRGQVDLCHIIPGMLRLSDRNLMPVVLAPMPMLAGHGRKDVGSHREHNTNYRIICESQYAALGVDRDYEYLIHDGGDVMPSQQVIAWFKKQFRISE
ncbi:MAG: dienelactone hydrolase family protein [Pirellulales bacterium]